MQKMSWKKNVCSVMLWAVYLLGSGAALLYYTYDLGLKNSYDDRTSATAAICLLMFVAGFAAILRFLVRTVRMRMTTQSVKETGRTAEIPNEAEKKNQGKTRRNEMLGAVLEAAVFVLLLAGGVVLRVWNLPIAGTDGDYYELTCVTAGSTLPYPAHGATGLYLHLLRALFYLVGNQWIAGIWLQIVLQVISAMLIYAALRKLAGRIPAICALGIIMLLPFSVVTGLTYSPEPLYLCCYAAGLLIVALCLQYHTDTERRAAGWLCVALAGIVLAMIVWLDISAVTLPVLFGALIWIRTDQQYGNAVRVIGKIMLFFILFLLAFAGMIGCYSYISGRELAEYFESWLALYTPETGNLFFLQPGEWQLVLVVVLCGMVYSGVIYWFREVKDRISPWFGPVIVLCALCILQIPSSQMSSIWMLAGFAGVIIITGIVETFRIEVGVTENKVSENEKNAALEAVTQEREEENSPEREEKAIPVSGRPPRQIANPLPLPKKSVRRAAEYGIEVREEDLHYDVDVAENDDFDKYLG